MALVVNDRVKETSTTTGTGTFDLAGAATGFETFVAGIATGNTTYYAIFNQGTTEWEVGLGTVTDATPDTLARTTIISSSNSDSAVDFAAGTKDVFCTLPASKAVFGKQEGTNFTNSLLVGHSTTGTLSSAEKNTGVGIDAMDAITSGDNSTAIGQEALGAMTTSPQNTAVGMRALRDLNTGSGLNTAVGKSACGNTVIGTRNTAVGYEALLGVSANTHSYDTALGAFALKGMTTGGYNIGIGWEAGDNITTGSGNVVIGKADVSSATGDDQLSISDGEDGTVVWMTGESTGNVEINETWNPSLSTTGKAFVMGF